MLGELSKYQRVIVTPSDGTYINISHSLGKKPKIIIFDSDQTFNGTNTYVVRGTLGNGCGGALTFDATTGIANVTNSYLEVSEDNTVTNSRYYMTDSTVEIRRITSGRYFNTNVAYTIDIYA